MDRHQLHPPLHSGRVSPRRPLAAAPSWVALPIPAFWLGSPFPPIPYCSLSAMRLPFLPPCPKPCRVHDLVTVCICTGGRGEQDREQPEGLGTGQCGQDSGPDQVHLSSGLRSTLPWDSGSFLDPNLALPCPALPPGFSSAPHHAKAPGGWGPAGHMVLLFRLGERCPRG